MAVIIINMFSYRFMDYGIVGLLLAVRLLLKIGRAKYLYGNIF